MSRKSVIKDIHLERRNFSTRLVVLVGLVIVLTLMLVARMASLQVFSHHHYSSLARNNRVRLMPVPPSRGLIYDRNGILLAENIPSYRLEIVPSQVKDLGRTLLQLKKLLNLSEDEIKRFERQRRKTPSFQGVPLRVRMSEADVARFYVERYRFPGVDVRAGLTRSYPFGAALAHVLGYVGRINERELKKLDVKNYRGSTHVGKTGIERYYETVLHGKSGVRQAEINSRGQFVRTLEEQPPVTGDGLILSLDIKLQQVAIEAMGPENSGAVIALDPRNGDVLALVSQPGFDPNLFVNGISRKAYGRLRDNPERPLFNRAVQGRYPPGSTVKPLTALAGLEFGVTTPQTQMFAGPYYSLANDPHRYRDWKKGGHGWVDMDKAITQSCDVYFYDLSDKLGIDHLTEMFARFGFGHKTGIDLPVESSGLLPSREWKRRRHGQAWFPGETLIVGIGQGYLLATPLQLAYEAACLAMHGHCATPRLLKSRLTENPHPESLDESSVAPVKLHDEAIWDTVIGGMEHVNQSINGTARRAFQGATYLSAGKTGTAQVFGVKQDAEYNEEGLARRLRDHALYIGFAPVDAPTIAVAVVVEHGGHGSRTAAPMARKVMDAWLSSGTRKPRAGEQTQ